MADTVNQEPVRTAGYVGAGTITSSLLALQYPVFDLLLEMGAPERRARAIINFLMVFIPAVVALVSIRWTRRQVVTNDTANNLIEQAFALPIGTPERVLKELLVSPNVETEKKEEKIS